MPGVRRSEQAAAKDASAASGRVSDASSEASCIELVIVRHGQTPGNAKRRYVGCRDDQPLSELGREQAREAAPRYAALGLADEKRVYVSTLRRTWETAAILFPQAQQVVVEGIQEMDFGLFTGRSADEMADDEAYQAWLESWCEDTCPEGESKAQFKERVCTAMRSFLREAAARGESRACLVAHGGTIMSFLDGFADEGRSYYDWMVGNCEGYRMRVAFEGQDVVVRDVEHLK